MKAGESLPLFVYEVFLTIISNECKMANKYFYTYIHCTEKSENNSFIPRKVALSYWNSLIFDVNHRTIWHQGMPFGNVYPGTLSYGETFNDIDNNIAQGPYAHAEGRNTIARYDGADYDSDNWDNNHDEAKGGMHAEGDSTIASGLASHAEGASTYSPGLASHAEGKGSQAQNDYSHAEGDKTIASGLSSHAEGNESNASGDISHAEGEMTKAKGRASHAEGINTEASGYVSHAEGKESLAKGDVSHAEGKGQTSSDYSHAEGQGTIDENSGNSHAENIGIITGSEYAHAEGASTVKAGSNYGHAEGHGSTVHQGVAAHAEGEQTNAQGKGAHSEGISTNALAEGSHAEGTNVTIQPNSLYAHGEGQSNNIDLSVDAHVEGYDNTITNSAHAHVEGRANKVTNSPASHAEGESNILTNAVNAHAEGTKNTASGIYAHVEGIGNIASGVSSHAQGDSNIAAGVNTFVSGVHNTVEGADSSILAGSDSGINEYVIRSVAAGRKIFLGNYQSNGQEVTVEAQGAFGTGLMTSNNNEFVVGRWNVSYTTGVNGGTDLFDGGTNSYQSLFTIGCGGDEDQRRNAMDVRANGISVFYKEGFMYDQGDPNNQNCFPEGLYPFATRQYVDRHDVGLRNWEGSGTAPNYTYKYVNAEYFNNYVSNKARADYSHAEGSFTTSYGVASHAEGLGTITRNEGEHASGKYNISTEGETIFSVGGGNGLGQERNLLEVKYANQENGIAFVDSKPIVTALSPRAIDTSTYIWTGTYKEYKDEGGENGDQYDDHTLYFVEDGDAVNRNDIITRDDIMGLVNTMNVSLDQKMNGVVKSAATLAETNNKILQKIGQSCSMSVTYSYIWTGSNEEYEDLMTYLNNNLFNNPPTNANDPNYVAYNIAKNMQYIIHM